MTENEPRRRLTLPVIGSWPIGSGVSIKNDELGELIIVADGRELMRIAPGEEAEFRAVARRKYGLTGPVVNKWEKKT